MIFVSHFQFTAGIIIFCDSQCYQYCGETRGLIPHTGKGPGGAISHIHGGMVGSIFCPNTCRAVDAFPPSQRRFRVSEGLDLVFGELHWALGRGPLCVPRQAM